MAHVIGSCSTLPGAHHKVPADAMCDDHPHLKAAYRIQGETDSFGAELNDFCEACFHKHKTAMAAYREEAKHGMCEWCKNHADDLRDRRDFEEGTCGRVYRVCGACVKRQNDELEEELEASGYYDRQDDGWGGDDGLNGEDDDEGWPGDSVDESSQEHQESLLRDLGPQMSDEGQPPAGARAYIDGKFIY